MFKDIEECVQKWRCVLFYGDCVPSSWLCVCTEDPHSLRLCFSPVHKESTVWEGISLSLSLSLFLHTQTNLCICHPLYWLTV